MLRADLFARPTPGPSFRVQSWENGNGIKSRRQRPARRWQASPERRRYGTSSAWSEGRSGQAGHRENDAAARKEYAKISGPRAYVLEPFPFRSNRNGSLDSCFDAFSSREPVSTPDQVRGRLSLENALARTRLLIRCNGSLGAASTKQPSRRLAAFRAAAGAERVVAQRRVLQISLF